MKERIVNRKFRINQQQLTVIVFSLFFAWILSFPFEGQLVYAFSEKFSQNVGSIVFSAIFAHFIGLFLCGFFVKNAAYAKKVILITSLFCLFGSIAFFFRISGAMIILIDVLSFAAGLFVAAWGYFFKSGTPAGKRIKTAADVLIYSNILMIIINAASVFFSAYAGLALAILTLAGVFVFALKLDENYRTDDAYKPSAPFEQPRSVAKPLLFLFFFIVVITINSGLMYEVINPAFEQFEMLSVWYWAVPYIVALIIMRNLPQKANRPYILYVAIAMIGFTFLFFMMLSRTAASHLLIDTLMLGACGIFDLFWWSILGEMLELSRNPAKLFGIGLSANVLGVLIGAVAGNLIFNADPYGINPVIIALIIVFVVLLILPVLNKILSNVLSDHVYLTRISDLTEQERTREFEDFSRRFRLTERESEIIVLLLKGRTYKLIAVELYLSENTVKTHLKNAYSKLGVKNKAELINFVENS